MGFATAKKKLKISQLFAWIEEIGLTSGKVKEMFFTILGTTPTQKVFRGVTNPRGLSPQHTGLQHAVFRLQQEVTRPKAKFKPTLPEKSEVDVGSNQGPTNLNFYMS